MAKYVVGKERLTAIADKIRSLLGLTGTMKLDEMANNLGTVNAEVDTQAELISQISTVLEGKAGGGEDVTAEVAAYTTKLAELDTALTALEQELAGKASGGSGGENAETCMVSISIPANYYCVCDGMTAAITTPVTTTFENDFIFSLGWAADCTIKKGSVLYVVKQFYNVNNSLKNATVTGDITHTYDGANHGARFLIEGNGTITISE